MQKTSRLLSGKRELCGNKIRWKRDTTDHPSVFYLHRLRVCACTSIILQGTIHKMLILWSIRSTKTLMWWLTRWWYDGALIIKTNKDLTIDLMIDHNGYALMCVLFISMIHILNPTENADLTIDVFWISRAYAVCVRCVFLETESLLCSIGNEIRENLACLFRFVCVRCIRCILPPLWLCIPHTVFRMRIRDTGDLPDIQSVITLQYAGIRCNTLQHAAGLKCLCEATGMHAHAATYCNTLQHSCEHTADLKCL